MVLGKTGAPIKLRAMMYKAVLHTVLLYGSEIRVVMHAMMTVIEVFCHSIAIQVVEIKARKGNGG